MKVLHRAARALAWLCLVLGVRVASAQGYLAPAWNEPCPLPSPTANASFVADGNVRPAGCDQPVYAEPMACDSPAPCSYPENTDPETYEWCVPTRCCPGWNFYAGALLIQRSRPVPASIVTPSMAAPGTIVDAGSFGFDYELGPEFSIQRITASGITWEGRYFGNHDADARFLVPAINTFRIAGIGVTILGGGSIDSFYSTDIDNTEINAWKQLTPGFSVLAGFRWVELHDTLRVNMATPATFAQWDENNHLYGGQFGGKLSMFSPGSPLQFDAVAKAGVFGNFAHNQFTSTVVGSDESTDSRAAFVGEVNLSLAYQLTDRLTARAGYMILWIDGVALAGEAAAITTQVPGGTSSPTPLDGNLWYNGATFGFDLTF